MFMISKIFEFFFSSIIDKKAGIMKRINVEIGYKYSEIRVPMNNSKFQ